MIECTRKIEFDAAHRVMGHEHKCRFLHGHRYVLEITASAINLDKIGRVVDFGVLKQIIKNWVDQNLDHTAILCKKDIELGEFIANYTKQKIYYLSENPTAENIALHLKHDILPILFNNYNFTFNKVKLYETPNCFVKV